MKPQDDVVIAVDAPYTAKRELAKGGTFFVGLVAALAGINGLLLLISGKSQGWAVLIFSSSLWIVFFAIRVIRRRSDRIRTALPAGQIHLTATTISLPLVTGDVRTIRWMDLSAVRMTRDTAGIIWYRLESGSDEPAIVVARTRVRDPETLDRELEARAPRFERMFEWEKSPDRTPGSGERTQAPLATDEVAGEQFRLYLPASGWQMVRGCGGLILAIVVVFALSFAYPDVALAWFKHPLAFMAMTAALIGGMVLAGRSRKCWLIAGTDGLHMRGRRIDFPSFIRWSDLLDHTIVPTGGRNPRLNLTVWTPAGSWRLDGIRIAGEEEFKRVLTARGGRKN